MLNKSNSIGVGEGHRLNTRYVTWSSGPGEDLARVFLDGNLQLTQRKGALIKSVAW